jgi:hypothetical protein
MTPVADIAILVSVGATPAFMSPLALQAGSGSTSDESKVERRSAVFKRWTADCHRQFVQLTVLGSSQVRPPGLDFGTTRNAPRMNGWMRQKYV